MRGSERMQVSSESKTLVAPNVVQARQFTVPSIVRNLASVGAATLVARLIGLLMLGYAARAVGPAGYGTVGYALSITSYASILLLPGLLTWGTREIAQHKDRSGEILWTVNIIQIGLAAVAFAITCCYARYCSRNGTEAGVIAICSLSLFATAISVDWVFNGLEKTWIAAWLSALGVGMNAICLILFVHKPQDLYPYAAIAPGVTGLTAVVGYLILGKKKLCKQSRQLRVGRAFLSALPLSIIVTLIIILRYANSIIIHACLGSAALGIFLASFRLFELVTTVPALIGTVFLPEISATAVKDRASARMKASKYVETSVLIGACVGILIALEAQRIIHAIYGAQYDAATQVLRILAIGIPFNFAIAGCTNSLIAFGEERLLVHVVTGSAIVSVIGGLIAVPRFGIHGAAVILASVDLAGLLICLPRYHRIVGTWALKIWVSPTCICFLLAGLRMYAPWSSRSAVVDILTEFGIVGAFMVMRLKAVFF